MNTKDLHAVIAEMQVLIGQAADRIAHFADELAKSHTVDGIVKDLDVQLMLESDADLVDHLRAAALPWDQRHKKPATEDSSASWPAQHLPDAIHHTDTSEHPEYIAGWNDCRAAMKGGAA